MKTKSFIPAVVALTLLLSASSSMAATILDSLGETAAAAADRTNMINPDTKYVNVQTSHKFDVGGKKFTWDYYGIHMAF
jgi:hypothetical protein